MERLESIEHRPWALPTEPWLMEQCWYDLLFAHWQVPADVLRPLVARELPLDTRFVERADAHYCIPRRGVLPHEFLAFGAGGVGAAAAVNPRQSAGGAGSARGAGAGPARRQYPRSAAALDAAGATVAMTRSSQGPGNRPFGFLRGRSKCPSSNRSQGSKG